MPMKCADIMSKRLEYVTETATVQQAAIVMRESGVGFLPICDAAGRVIGVVTDRDLATRALAAKLAPTTTSAAMVMTSPAVTCLETTNIRDAADLMAAERKSRLVITDASGRLVGVLSLADLVERTPMRSSARTVRAVLWREALGPRGGAARGQRLLKDDPAARAVPSASDDVEARPTVFTGGHRMTDTKEFPR
jgi:CBS domain-containing protein